MRIVLICGLILALGFLCVIIPWTFVRYRRKKAAIAARAEVTSRVEGVSYANLHRAFYGQNPPAWGDGFYSAPARDLTTEEFAELHRENFRNAFPKTAAAWNDDDAGDPLPAAMMAPPNIGGDGHLDYRGPNYVEPDEIVAEMKALWQMPDAEPTVRIDDLCYFYRQPGLVAPDGSVWASESSRITTGVVEVLPGEADKAERFGWRQIGIGNGTIRMHRTTDPNVFDFDRYRRHR